MFLTKLHNYDYFYKIFKKRSKKVLFIYMYINESENQIFEWNIYRKRSSRYPVELQMGKGKNRVIYHLIWFGARTSYDCCWREAQTSHGILFLFISFIISYLYVWNYELFFVQKWCNNNFVLEIFSQLGEVNWWNKNGK